MNDKFQILSLLVLAVIVPTGCYELPEPLTEIPDTTVLPDGERAKLCGTEPLTCDDGNECTVDQCQAGQVCENKADDTLCNDNLACTIDQCSEESGCSSTPDDSLCPVATGLCQAYQCLGKGCTDPSCTDGCQLQAVEGCTQALCAFSGAPDQQSDCSIDLVVFAHAANIDDGPAAMQFTLNYDASKVNYEKLLSAETGNALPGVLPTGHNVTIDASVMGRIAITITKPEASPEQMISSVVQNKDDKSPSILTLRVKNLVQIAQLNPSFVTLNTDEKLAADAVDGTAMHIQIQNNQLVLCKPVTCESSCENKLTGQKTTDGCFDDAAYGCPCGWTPTPCQPTVEQYTSCPDEFGYLTGDFNCTGKIDTSDVQIVANYINNAVCHPELPPEHCPADEPLWFDVNCDGVLDESDSEFMFEVSVAILAGAQSSDHDNDGDGIHDSCDPDDDNDDCPDQCEVDIALAGGDVDALVACDPDKPEECGTRLALTKSLCGDCECFNCSPSIDLDVDKDGQLNRCDDDDDDDGFSDLCEQADGVNTDPKDKASTPTAEQVANEALCTQ